MGSELELLKDGTHGTHKDVSEGPYLLSAKNIKDGKIIITNNERRISNFDYDKIHKNFSLKEQDILLTIVESIGETAILKNPDKITFQRSVAYLRAKNLNSQFLYTLINHSNFQNELNNRKVVSAQPGIYLGDLAKINIVFPINNEEQKRIGQLFQQLDETITLHQRKGTHIYKSVSFKIKTKGRVLCLLLKRIILNVCFRITLLKS